MSSLHVLISVLDLEVLYLNKDAINTIRFCRATESFGMMTEKLSRCASRVVIEQRNLSTVVELHVV